MQQEGSAPRALAGRACWIACALACTALAACGTTSKTSGSKSSPGDSKTGAPTGGPAHPDKTASPLEIALGYLRAAGTGDPAATCAAARLPAGCRVGGRLDSANQANARGCAALQPVKGTRDLSPDAGTNDLQPPDGAGDTFLLYGVGIKYVNGGVVLDKSTFDVSCEAQGSIGIVVEGDPGGGYRIKSADFGQGG
jgi:hypothetical protein